MKKLVLSLFIVNFIFAANAQDEYSSIAGGAWDIPATWQNITQAENPATTKPGALDNVTINNHTVIIDQDESVNNITLANTAIGGMIIQPTVSAPGHVLTVNGSIVNSGVLGSIIIGDFAKVSMVGSTVTFITPLGSNMSFLGALGTLEINNSVGVDIALGTSTVVNCYGIVSVVSGNFATDDRLVLKAATPTSFGRFSFTDYDATVLPNAGRTVYPGTITGDVTMEKVIEPTSLADNAGWRQWSFPLNATASDITGLDIQGTGHIPATAINAYSWNAEGDGASTGDPSPLGNGKTLNSGAAAGWATGWESVDETSIYGKGLTVYSTQNTNTNTAYGYSISYTISITGTVATGNVTGGYDISGNAAPADIYLPGSQDPGLPDLGGTSTDDIGWVQLYNPWPTIIDTWGLLSERIPNGGGWNAASGASFNNTYGAIHVWDARSQQYLGWTTNAAGAAGLIYNTAGGVTAPGVQTSFDILPFQSFWVKGDAGLLANGNIDFDIKYTKPSIEGPAYLKTNSINQDNLVAMAVYDADSMSDTWGVHYEGSFTQNFDLRGDLYKIISASDVPTLYSLEGGNRTHVANRPPVGLDTIQLYFASNKDNKPVHFHYNDAYGDNLNVVLLDRKTGMSHNLSQTPNYTFTHNTSNDSYRFQLVLSNKTISIDEEVLASNPVQVYMSAEEMVIKSIDFTGPASIECYDMSGRLLFGRKVDLVAGQELRFIAPLAKNQINMVVITAKGQTYTERIFR